MLAKNEERLKKLLEEINLAIQERCSGSGVHWSLEKTLDDFAPIIAAITARAMLYTPVEDETELAELIQNL